MPAGWSSACRETRAAVRFRGSQLVAATTHTRSIGEEETHSQTGNSTVLRSYVSAIITMHTILGLARASCCWISLLRPAGSPAAQLLAYCHNAWQPQPASATVPSMTPPAGQAASHSRRRHLGARPLSSRASWPAAAYERRIAGVDAARRRRCMRGWDPV